ncbi:phosphatase YbhA [[Pasteurella] aerogenes]|nr:phosphatase YbhA [[Pasteurella] aerogenes]
MPTTTYRAVFSDIDGTLLNSQHQITPKTVQAIQRIHRQGIPFILVSARPPLAMTPYTTQLQLQNALVCYSGALILDNDLNPLYSIAIEEKTLQRLNADLATTSSLSINHYANLDWFSNDLNNEWTLQEAEITGLTAKPTPQTLSFVHKILIMGNAMEIQALEAELKPKYPELAIHRSKNEYLEIMHKNASKSHAIRFMEKVLGIERAEIIAFGDNYNDLDMLEYAGLSVAMANAPQEIKQAAKRVTASNNEDGIALVLDDIF